MLGSQSTCLAAHFGGLHGRSLENGDSLSVQATEFEHDLKTPDAYRFTPPSSVMIRAVPMPGADSDALFDSKLTVDARADRMGVQLTALATGGAGNLPSQPVFPGGIQLPPDGRPFVLGVDAQTTGGYALIANVARVDRHMIGQLRPGSSLTMTRRESGQARDELLQKVAHFRAWLGDSGVAIR